MNSSNRNIRNEKPLLHFHRLCCYIDRDGKGGKDDGMKCRWYVAVGVAILLVAIGLLISLTLHLGGRDIYAVTSLIHTGGNFYQGI